jgi:integrase
MRKLLLGRFVLLHVEQFAHGVNFLRNSLNVLGYMSQVLCQWRGQHDRNARITKRGIGLQEEVARLLKLHRAEQDRERKKAEQLWTESGYVFTTETGAPLNPRTDYDEWKRLVKAAGVPDGRLHDARHTAATVLLLLDVAERTVMGIMGWTNTAMAAKYQHITSAIRQDVAQRVGGLLWEPVDIATRATDEDDDGTAGALVSVG